MPKLADNTRPSSNLDMDKFMEIISKVDKNNVGPDFWEKEKESFARIDKEDLEFKMSTRMTHEKLHTPFDI